MEHTDKLNPEQRPRRSKPESPWYYKAELDLA